MENQYSTYTFNTFSAYQYIIVQSPRYFEFIIRYHYLNQRIWVNQMQKYNLSELIIQKNI